MPLYAEGNQLVLRPLGLAGSKSCCCDGGDTNPDPERCVGACCVGNVCSERTLSECFSLNGLWYGCDSQCSSPLCSNKLSCADCCAFPNEISASLSASPVEVCFLTSSPSGLTVSAKIDTFSLSAQVTLTRTAVSSSQCARYDFAGVTGNTFLVITIVAIRSNLRCFWSLQELAFVQANNESSTFAGPYDLPPQLLFRHYVSGTGALEFQTPLDSYAASGPGCAGGTYRATFPISWNSDFFCARLNCFNDAFQCSALGVKTSNIRLDFRA